MNTSAIRLFVEKDAIHQIKRISEYAAIVVGIRKAGGSRSEPMMEAYIDIVVQHPMGYCSRFGIKSDIMNDRLPPYILQDLQLRESINFLLLAGLVANSDHAENMIRHTVDDTIQQALKLTYAPR